MFYQAVTKENFELYSRLVKVAKRTNVKLICHIKKIIEKEKDRFQNFIPQKQAYKENYIKLKTKMLDKENQYLENKLKTV